MKRKEILKMIQDGSISVDDGIKVINSLRSNVESEPLISTYQDTDIAVIGISGRFPGANDIAEYWENLCNGVDSVNEIPEKRWDVSRYYSPDTKAKDRTYCKWGGTIDDCECFDPLFFQISPKEAQLMDPQQRIILEEAWKAVEDSGYTPTQLAKKNCGVFIGATQGDYNKRIMNSGISSNAQTMTGTQISMLAARISYYMNLDGPNITIDTACSSSLVAIHMACKSIENNESEIALAGGINILTTPDIYIMTSKGEMLSKQGKCKAFDQSADGFVPSEGAGILVLKSANQAIKDGDNIYGIIKGSCVNQDGKTNGITAPSAKSQTKLEIDTYKKFNINPETISYIEAHGTGTKLGDPIEISALTKAFRNFTTKSDYCAIGAVKSNLGHALVASGVLSMIKVLMCLKHQMLVPSIHYKDCNEHIKFEGSPFYVNTQLKKWDSISGELRRAAISSFGLSGTNCHMIVEEAPKNYRKNLIEMPSYLIPISAKSEESLKSMCCKLYDYLCQNQCNIGDVAYTMSVGREHHDIRMYVIVDSINDLKEKLVQVIEGQSVIGVGKNVLKGSELLYSDKDDYSMTYLSDCILGKDDIDREFTAKLEEAARNYILGRNLKWYELYQNTDYRKISLPTYAFEKNRYWLEYESQQEKVESFLHPVIDKNISDFNDIKFEKTFTGMEFYCLDHIFDGMKIVPGAVQLEMALKAVELITGIRKGVIKDVLWITPIVAENSCKAIIKLKEVKDEIEFKITDENGSIYSRGNISFEQECDDLCPLNFDSIKQNRETISKEEIYNDFEKSGMKYGSSFQVVEKMYVNEKYCLAEVNLDEVMKQSLHLYVLHPALMDGAFQTVAAFKGVFGTSNEMAYLPYGIGKFNVLDSLEEKCYIYAVPSDRTMANSSEQCFNITIYGKSGNVIGEIRDYTVKYVGNMINKKELSQSKPREDNQDVIYYTNEIQKTSIPDSFHEISGNVLLFCRDAVFFDAMKERTSGNIFRVHLEQDDKVVSENEFVIHDASVEQYENILKCINERKITLTTVILMNEWLDQNDDGALEEVKRKTVYPILYLSQALLKFNIEVQFLIVNKIKEGKTIPFYSALAGFCKTMVLENPNYLYRILNIDQPKDEMIQIIINELGKAEKEYEIYYHKNERLIKRYKEVPKETEQDKGNLPIKQQGVYLITGGAGGLGLVFADYLAKNYHATVVLTGRSEISDPIQEKIKEFNQFGQAYYVSTDITKAEQTKALVQMVRDKHGHLDGVIHSAGVIKDSFIRFKKQDEFEQVILPKVDGLVALDLATKDDKLDIFVAFASLGGVTGNVGQCDYAYANQFIDDYISYRNELVMKNQRYGISKSIDWPLWSTGSMSVDENTKRKLKSVFGMTPLALSNGIRAFEDALLFPCTNVIVMGGNKNELMQKREILHMNRTTWNKKEKFDNQIDETIFFNKSKDFIKGIIARTIALEPEKLYDKEPFETYGIDSVMIVSINDELEQHFGEISKTLLFEYKDIYSLTAYFVENMRERLYQELNLEQPVKDVSVAELDILQEELKDKIEEKVELDKNNTHKSYESDDIAIIGIAGTYPLADDLEMFWDNLKNGVDCITEIPKERWDYHKNFSIEKGDNGTNYSKWGGFLRDVDKFDALNFSISPKEAEMMDPQERLFLETAWKTMQDAGYTKSTMKDKNVGVYVGVMYGHYELYGVEQTMKGNPIALNSSFSSIANRVSYYFDFTGPSMAIDTMCSSTLTALHIACQSIRNEDCNAAIVGAANLSLHESKYLLLSQGKFLATDGRCKSFGTGGDGYVPGEGVGAILIKSMKDALRDGDHIYAIIKGTALNHGGKTNGYTVPNPVEQGNVIAKAVKRAKVDVSTISYIEAHGTGTSLGDPIEFNGLARGMSLPKNSKCAIGSVKSNIGHLEAASGMAAITKVILMMKNKMIVPSLHSNPINENLNIDKTPFYVPQKAEYWNLINDRTTDSSEHCPRRAGISSFGAGGSNGHVILEECTENPNVHRGENQEELFVFSAETEDLLIEYLGRIQGVLRNNKKAVDGSSMTGLNLKDMVKDQIKSYICQTFDIKEGQVNFNESLNEYGMNPIMIQKLLIGLNDSLNCSLSFNDFIDVQSLNCLVDKIMIRISDVENQNFNMEDIAYTLQVGRDSMKVKLAIQANSLHELLQKLDLFIEDRDIKSSKYYYGNKRSGNKEVDMINDALNSRNLESLAKLWMEGYHIDWNRLWNECDVKRQSLPIPKLNSKHYWFDGLIKTNAKSEEVEKSVKVESDFEKRITVSDTMLEAQMENASQLEDKKYVTVEYINEQIALVRMQDRNNRNMYSNELIDGLMAAFYGIRNNKMVKVVIITGYDTVFCMGGMKEQLIGIADRELAFTDAPFLYKGLMKLDIPVISAMQGHASGGGMLFGLYADVTIMAEEAVYSAPFTKYGFTPGMGATYILPKKLGDNIAREMMYTAVSYRGEELKAKGASVIIKKSEEVLQEAVKIAKSIAEKPRLTLSMLKKSYVERELISLEKAIELEEEMHRITFANPEVKERINYYYSRMETDKSKSNSKKVAHVKKDNVKQGTEKSNADEEALKILTYLEEGKITPQQASALMKLV